MPKTETTKKKKLRETHLYLDEETYKAIRDLAEDNDRSMTAECLRAVKEYVRVHV